MVVAYFYPKVQVFNSEEGQMSIAEHRSLTPYQKVQGGYMDSVHWHSSFLTPSGFSFQDLLSQDTVKDSQIADVHCKDIVNWLPQFCQVCSVTVLDTHIITYLYNYTLL